MKRHNLLGVLALCTAGLLFESAGANGPLSVEDAWAMATPPTARNGAVYLVVEQHGEQADRLIGAASTVAERTELHTHIMQDGMMMMRRLDGLEVVPGEPLTFEPGGHHVMLMGLHHPLTAGQRFPLTLRFESGGDVQVTVAVRAMGEM